MTLTNKLIIFAICTFILTLIIYNQTHTFSKTIVIKDKIKVRQRGRYSTFTYYELTDQNGIKYKISQNLASKVEIGAVINVKGNDNLIDKSEITEIL